MLLADEVLWPRLERLVDSYVFVIAYKYLKGKLAIAPRWAVSSAGISSAWY